ncbi:FAD-binding oxidoreductase [Thermasporomyces composti]|uniref:Glycolate oxidase FAD binding subunit n=1 Tax=Thermasporomyces composti TaxID=696763 RepID=A0A3D9VKQ2_THECX|nr:FAD-binding oxidoreductase [Thermasporomyces composti]REF37951.1 glycolate oxidase FAD binding subunit [Thermasporomyces composti]
MSSSGSDLASPQVARPRDLREARDVFVAAARAGQRVLIRGTGTAQSWGAPVHDVDLVVDTTGLDRVLAYNPADMTVAVGAGIPLTDLHATLREQRVALDAARVAEGATVGGLLATADGGPLRLTYGTLRDLVIGVTVVLADGTVARSGGHVIKNVAGYDLAKLFAGSLGAFGLVAEVVLRLHPRPKATGTLVVPCDVPTAFTHATTLLASPWEPAAVDWCDGTLLARFEGTPTGVETRLHKAATSLGVDHDIVDGPREAATWAQVAEVVRGVEGDTVLRAGTRPDALPQLAAALDSLAAEHGVEASLTSSLGVGVHTVRLRGGSLDGHAHVVRAWRRRVLESGGSVTLHRRPHALDELVPSWGPAPTSATLLRALKQQLDPDGRLAPGRFAPWL